MGYRVKGTLKLPDGSPASNAEIEFISRKNYSPLVQELKSNILCGPSGAYDVTLEFGEYAVMVYPGGTYPAALGTIVLAADTVAGQDLPTLLQQSGWQPATPEYIQQIGAWLAEANASATSSAASASAAKVSETNAAASASAAANAIVTHEGKAGAHPIGGVTGLQAALDGKYSPANKPTAADVGAFPVTGGVLTGRSYVDTGVDVEPQLGTKRDGRSLFFSDNGSTMGVYSSGISAKDPSWLVKRDVVTGDISMGDDRSSTKISGKDSTFTYKGNEVYHTGNVVGSGGIIERGSNANGEYVKFADGTMICALPTLSGIFANASNIAFAGEAVNRVVNFPATFSSIHTVSSVLILNSALIISPAGNLFFGGATGSTLGIAYLLNNAASFTKADADNTSIWVTAAGRWK